MDWHNLTDDERREKIKRLEEWWEKPSDEDLPQIMSDLRVLAMNDLARDHREACTSFPAEISDLMGGYDVPNEMVLSTMNYWRTARQTAKKFNGDVLVRWCADQIAAALVFMNLRRIQSAIAPQKRLWESLLCRLVDHIFIPWLAREARRQPSRAARIFAEKEVLKNRFIRLILEDRTFEFQFPGEDKGDGQEKKEDGQERIDS